MSVSPPVELRALGVADAALLAALHQRGFDAPWDAPSFATLLASPGLFGVLAHDAAQPHGFILARAIADEAEIITLMVAPARRRRGIAATLLAQAEARARAEGAATMFLEVAETNEAARALYTAAGFRQVGRRRRYYPDGGDALLLRKEL